MASDQEIAGSNPVGPIKIMAVKNKKNPIKKKKMVKKTKTVKKTSKKAKPLKYPK